MATYECKKCGKTWSFPPPSTMKCTQGGYHTLRIIESWTKSIFKDNISARVVKRFPN